MSLEGHEKRKAKQCHASMVRLGRNFRECSVRRKVSVRSSLNEKGVLQFVKQKENAVA